ncbi:lipopolysaccharide assembly protein LapA domain-containing protein [Tabrizicola oligotrophica]|uniref:lipopolysaccharide assembly protein LapA domain-containing protein n=1 Tax=Tabrizicola oligotrophica TaxID=2710650 RepID=UPI001D0F559B|nr:LapA family protein [Tabrizicola oligotrophica]
MIRYLRYLFLAVLALSLLTVAMANRAPVQIKALPDDIAAFTGLAWQLELPLFLVIFGGMIAGLLIGFVWEWLRERKHRSAASRQSREVTRLERELAVMKDSVSVPKDDVLAILEKPKA